MPIPTLSHPVPEADYPDIGFSWVSPPINFAPTPTRSISGIARSMMRGTVVQ
jgi:hypothetical protein